MNRATPRASLSPVVTLEVACHAGGRGFEPRRSRLSVCLQDPAAQTMASARPRNPRTGSSAAVNEACAHCQRRLAAALRSAERRTGRRAPLPEAYLVPGLLKDRRNLGFGDE